ncbi:hypothetical protein BDP81DRAFT_428987 [Colletotrichum phormii]|uniref:Uncharacterized protein n=1 Tax=Colletotrichum phormii TaxID=359342 RepID=A0AAJ0EGH8_9PEZI|nr:uncharacterized protein BDP81DRAFT_428987 [Colletotrichum phormii]KAK1636071.1 hypothetical protein BDP81DRAFT_428987 [Colletotrichum phormii]
MCLHSMERERSRIPPRNRASHGKRHENQQSRTPSTGRHWTSRSLSPPHPLLHRVTPPANG